MRFPDFSGGRARAPGPHRIEPRILRRTHYTTTQIQLTHLDWPFEIAGWKSGLQTGVLREDNEIVWNTPGWRIWQPWNPS